MRYRLIDQLQVYYQKETVLIQINEKVLPKQEHIFDIEESVDGFLEIEEMTFKDKKLEILYACPNDYSPLYQYRQFADFYKLEIVQTILNQRPTEPTFYHMANILVKNTKDILFVYKADHYGELPYSRLGEIDQIKVFICSLFGQYSLEKYQKDIERTVKKENHPLLLQVIECHSVEEIEQLIRDSLTTEQRVYFEEIQRQESRDKLMKRTNRLFKSSLIVAGILLYSCTTLFLIQSKEKAIKQVKEENKVEVQFLNKIIEGDSENIESDMKKMNLSKEKQVGIYIQLGEYEKAYEIDKKSDKEITQMLYKQGKIDQINELSLAGSAYLEDVQTILNTKDLSDLLPLLQVDTDSFLIELIAKKAIEQEAATILTTIRTQLLDNSSITLPQKLVSTIYDTLIQLNTDELEKIYSDSSLSEEQKKTKTNELLKENNELLTEKARE
ncbi:conjugal transfer protein TraF [Enterococcus cecorum]|uniref:conjugal transfer protein TraF n=1 Tax=Enterococcus cecorum TaxID=44008 RepID=UPI0022D072EF|nr:conjugal transfer protein TraF [Enterococcus cecorum]CAI3302526.1 conjugal transfer protein TraF [Enterococcus cecorum]CAI3368152.1 conjugal transfer protein TraF [Enterococcus cecorum]CAI3462240.1 conjugal transfer protein TraF [Enterococcus cecorum]CAI3468138.1 conjugal transfer protein TraF [Enterococcus cecorum]CAI3470915.1 conjugal transfer protein TraF [Enterococcus cecorum]